MSSKNAFNVVVVGAGEINFGSPEGPWNHTARLESILGSRLSVLSVVDPDVKRCQGRIDERRQGALPSAWSKTLASKDMQSAQDALGSTDVHLIVLGCPPHYRGTSSSGSDMDLQAIKAFPHAKGMLIEKPVAALDPLHADCDQVAAQLQQWSQGGAVVGVGYMLRYLTAVQKIKHIMVKHKLVPTCINARYYMSYEYARKLSWWNKAASCGPVVEQATHFVDLIRYLAGQDNAVDLRSVRATCVEHDEEAGKLSKLGFDEDAIDPSERVPRITTAFWKHAKGTLGTLCHGITLHDHPYDTELEILADGWVIKLKRAYTVKPTLSILGPHSSQEEVIEADDDPFESEMLALVQAVDRGQTEGVLSSFEDALQTYALTWTIRHASEKRT